MFCKSKTWMSRCFIFSATNLLIFNPILFVRCLCIFRNRCSFCRVFIGMFCFSSGFVLFFLIL